MNIVFMGTPDFARESLKALLDAGHKILGVFTQPDKKSGRGQKVNFSSVKEFALERNLKIFQPNSLKTEESFNLIKELNPELIVVVAYGKILPKNILDIPDKGCINVHGSLLPEYRGAAPIQWAILDGKKEAGVTTMFMDEGMDTGDVLLEEKVSINNDETSGELFSRLSVIGAKLLIKTIKCLEEKKLVPKKQDNDLATYTKMLTKEMGLIDWNQSAIKIYNLVRGLNPWPVAYTFLDGKKVKIYKVKVLKNISGNPGEIVNENPFIIACKDNEAIEVVELQMENKKRMLSSDFLRGYKIKNKFLS